MGIFLWILANRSENRKLKAEAIRNLMTYRGDYSSDKFRQSLNAVSVTFHKDAAIRKQIRELYDLINSSNPSGVNRKIVSLIYELCRKNYFKGITEYDIDQSFPEQSQIPTGEEATLYDSQSPRADKHRDDNQD